MERNSFRTLITKKNAAHRARNLQADNQCHLDNGIVLSNNGENVPVEKDFLFISKSFFYTGLLLKIFFCL